MYFYYSAKHQLLNEDTILISAAMGLYQGLKYKGSFKNGIKGGLATLVTISAVNGVMALIEDYDKIKNFTEEDLKDLFSKKEA
jgi:hypothetical protein